jgi:hypothetical protein
MAALRYEVVVADMYDGYVARIEELQCAAIGGTPKEALTLVREQALVVLRDFTDADPPCPLHQTIVSIEVPHPQEPGPPRKRHLVVIADDSELVV